ncbi:hypothetical protein M2451_002061 [Dysgonomonas sp. PFB1-18]|uniref:glycosyltransferase n=1 Tax=unclassified Dysgonomonas TaxID=2630389 RepID=UPI002475FFFB|nr:MULTISPECIES: hypothetical protein [unclassified Dysgonomonas]MDH6309755.1 hypothetical protein [Dysgonomonas sp. PF1-14]MDH6339237.1 hypothetical protein [Dysgonomonas sp. PF1-16]MDH6380736.1 hypothetical protein [Dysgonomonas sp. PFB1-18]MDH6398232.1 hypothetical protein [Dysgonomonas sp. PF1-23]
MNILVANHQLVKTGGTENYTYAIIVELLRLGHTVEYFAFLRGEISDKIEALGVKFRSKKTYDLIIANHNTTVELLYRYGFIIQTCHGMLPDLEQPAPHADHYVVISYEVQQYLKAKNIDSTLIYNGVDCERFSPKGEIKNTLTSVLSLCQSDEANRFISDCCSEIGVEFEKLNKHTDNLWEIETVINKSDLVVGIGRSLYDAMACGRTVISYDNRSYSKDFGDGYLNKENLEQSLMYNCSGRGMQKTFTKETFVKELEKYSKEDGIYMRNFALENFNIKLSVSQYLDIAPKAFTLKKMKVKKFFQLIQGYILYLLDHVKNK